MSIFDVCRKISAHEIAIRVRLPLKHSGSRYWAHCPFHLGGHEKTASLCFFSDGGWKCFGCGAGGDAVAFYQRFYKINSPKVAAKELAGLFDIQTEAFRIYIKPATPPGNILFDCVEAWFKTNWNCACDDFHACNQLIDLIQSYLPGSQDWDACWTHPAFGRAIAARSMAELWLAQLDETSEAGFENLMRLMQESGGLNVT